ncbi:TetR family transcriptional regulator [Actinoplanes sp. NPDC048967]|uniref:TetR/AcrR family transcriptional regulator n=1 Tax=Actinoplanes sp. NPDC048967 TaxID=3155269 RepID=UPI0033F305BC
MTQRLTRAQQQEVTRARLLDAAETLFGDRGIHQTSLDEIARAAGLTKGAIYANFGSKKDLITAILERKLAADDGAGDRPPGEALPAWADVLGASYERNVGRPEIQRFAMAFVELWLYGMREESSREPVGQWLRTVRASSAEELTELAGDDLPVPAEQLAALVLALDIGVGLQHWLDPEAVPADTYRAGLRALFGRELRPPGDAASR